MLKVILVAALVSVALAGGCDNDCSGHGNCLQNGVCACYDNWGMGMGLDSGDCSQRICPFEFAWVDTPDKLGNHHKYAECSNRGICDRDSGECECFPGYEGKGCARTTCPNDCSGHGRCKNIEDLPFGSTPKQFDSRSFFEQKAHSFGDAYKNWDAEKTRGCVCDPEWGDVDCSKRMCMHGNDIMDQRDNLNAAQKIHTQHIQFVSDTHKATLYSADGTVASAGDQGLFPGRTGIHSKTFALSFTSKLNETFTTIPIVMPTADTWAAMQIFFNHVEHALESLPNGVVDNVKVNGEFRVTHAAWTAGELNYQMATNQDPGGSLLEVADVLMNALATPTVTGVLATYDNVALVTVTGYGSGAKATVVHDGTDITSITVTTAGSGYVSGDTLKIIAGDMGSGSAQANITLTVDDIGGNSEGLDGGEEDMNSLYINVTFNGPNVQGFQNPLTVKHIFCNDGCTPKLTGVDLVYNTMNTTEIVLADYNSFECGRRGKCDYSSGVCDCFSGYSGLACGTITSLV